MNTVIFNAEDGDTIENIPDRHFKTRHLRLIYTDTIDDMSFKMMIKGRKAQALLWLIRIGKRGITSQEMSSWALRLGAYIHELRRSYGLDIATIDEQHEPGCIHARYRLITPVKLERVELTF